MKYIVIIGIVALLVLAGCGAKPKTAEVEPTTYSAEFKESLAKCLTSKDVIMYGASWCGHCNNQKKMFGDAVDYILFVDCDEKYDKCQALNITGYPTWVVDGVLLIGEQPLNVLAEAAGC